MDEEPLIQITPTDIAQANRLSLSCPICASSVEKNPLVDSLAPVVCANCQTLYHRACWEQNGGKCAVLGCGHTVSYRYGTHLGPRLTIHYSDLPKHVPRVPSPNGRHQKLKEEEKRRQKEADRRTFWSNLVESILRAVGWRR